LIDRQSIATGQRFGIRHLPNNSIDQATLRMERLELGAGVAQVVKICPSHEVISVGISFGIFSI
jgi:hypothetical protein